MYVSADHDGRRSADSVSERRIIMEEYKEYKCPWCGQEQTEEEMDFDEHDIPRYCFMCGKTIIEVESEEEVRNAYQKGE